MQTPKRVRTPDPRGKAGREAIAKARDEESKAQADGA